MGMDPVSIGLIMAGTGAAMGGASSFMQAGQAGKQAAAQRKYLQARGSAQAGAIETQIDQVRAQSALDRQKSADRAHLIMQRIRVAGGEAGMAGGGSYAAIMRQGMFDAAEDRRIIEQNAAMNIQRAKSGQEPIPNVPEPMSPWLGGLMGMMGGAQSGLSMGTSFLQIKGLK